MNQLIKKAFTVSVVASTIVWSMGLAAFVPVANATPVSGDLIKASLPAVYYYGADSKRYVFPNEKTYKTWYHDANGNSDFSTVKTITDSELAAISIGGNVTYKPGYRMVKVTTDPKVYAVDKAKNAEKGSLRGITSEAVASALYGSDWNKKIDDVPDAFFTNYDSTGAAINAAADFDKAAIEAAATNINTDKNLSGGQAGDLSVAIKSAPAAQVIPASSTVDFITYNVCAGSTEVKVSKLSLKRTGLGSDNDFSGVKTYWENAQKGSAATGDSNHYFKFTYTTNVTIPANTCKELTIKGDIAALATTGQSDELKLGLDAASAITSTAATVTGTFPMYSNAMTINENVTIGGLKVYEGADNPTSDYTLNIGDTGKTIMQARLEAQSAENVVVSQVYFKKSGTFDNDDATNWELYNATDSVSYGKLSSFDADNQLVYNFTLTIPKGESKTLTLKADVIDGTSRTVAVTLIDGTVWNMTAKGAYYGYGISPSTGSTWTGNGDTSPNGTNEPQTINQGTVTITKSTSTPATGNIAPGATGLAISAFDMIVKGEPMKFTAWENTVVLGTATYDQITNCGLYDDTNTIVAGPVDTTTKGTYTDDYIKFTDTFIVPTGTHTYTIKCNIASATSTGDTVQLGWVAANTESMGLNTVAVGTTAKGTVSNQTIAASPSSGNVIGNTLTVAAGALGVTTKTSPPAQTVVRGVKGFKFAEISLDAGSSGEDVKITSVTITDTVGSTQYGTDLINMTLKVDGVQYGDITQPDGSTIGTADTTAFTLSTPIIVPKASSKILEVYADVKTTATGDTSGTDADYTHQINLAATAANLVATGATTGLAIAEATTGNGQDMYIYTAGTLTAAASTSDPDTKIVVANSSGNTWNCYKFKPNYEDMRLDTIHFTLTDDLQPEDFKKLYLYHGSDKLAEAVTSVTPEFTNIGKINSKYPNGFTMTKNTEYNLCVKTDMEEIGYGKSGHSGDSGSIDLTPAADLDAVGLSSGSAIDASAVITTDLKNHWFYNTVPTFAKVSDSNTTLTSGVLEVGRFTVTADANAAVIFSGGQDANIKIDVYAAATVGSAATVTTGYLYNWENNIVSEIYSDWWVETDMNDNDYPYAWDFDDSYENSNGVTTVTIDAGMTKTLYFKVDVTPSGTAGNYFRAELKDSSNNIQYWDSNDYYGGTLYRDDLVSGTPTTLMPGLPITFNTYYKAA